MSKRDPKAYAPEPRKVVTEYGEHVLPHIRSSNRLARSGFYVQARKVQRIALDEAARIGKEIDLKSLGGLYQGFRSYADYKLTQEMGADERKSGYTPITALELFEINTFYRDIIGSYAGGQGYRMEFTFDTIDQRVMAAVFPEKDGDKARKKVYKEYKIAVEVAAKSFIEGLQGEEVLGHFAVATGMAQDFFGLIRQHPDMKSYRLQPMLFVETFDDKDTTVMKDYLLEHYKLIFKDHLELLMPELEPVSDATIDREVARSFVNLLEDQFFEASSDGNYSRAYQYMKAARSFASHHELNINEIHLDASLRFDKNRE